MQTATFYYDIRRLTSSLSLPYVELDTLTLRCRTAFLLPCLPALTSLAIVAIDLPAPQADTRLTSTRTFACTALDTPKLRCLVACPLPCLPAITSFAIVLTLFDIAGLGLGLGLVVTGLDGLGLALLDFSSSLFTSLISWSIIVRYLPGQAVFTKSLCRAYFIDLP